MICLYQFNVLILLKIKLIKQLTSFYIYLIFWVLYLLFYRKYSSFLDALSFWYFNPTDPLVLLYVRCKSGVFFALRRFRDAIVLNLGLYRPITGANRGWCLQCAQLITLETRTLRVSSRLTTVFDSIPGDSR